jgi:hypothetical protein
MAFDTTKVLAGRDFKVYTAPWSGSTALPANSIDPGTDWGSTWVDKGLITGGLRMSFAVDWVDIRVDQMLDTILKLPNGRTLTMNANLAQFTLANVREAMGLPASKLVTTAPVGATRGQDELVIDGAIPTPQYLSVGFEVSHPGDGMAIRIAAWKCMVGGTPSIEMAAATLVPITLDMTALPDTTTSPARIAVLRDVIPGA